MAEIHIHDPGDFCWVELGTTDADAAKAFYGALFGWTSDDIPLGGEGVYTMLKLRDLEVAGMYQMSGEMQQEGIPPHWLTYVTVENVDDAMGRAAQLGSQIMSGPLDVPGAGRVAVLLDRSGAMFAVWEAKGRIGARIRDDVGVRTWSELATTDGEKATAFYTGLFGWQAKVDRTGPMPYTEWVNAGRPIGGMFEMGSEWQGVPPHWMPYFRVARCDEAVAAAGELGASIPVPPTDIPKVGRFALLADPQGAAFSIVELAG